MPITTQSNRGMQLRKPASEVINYVGIRGEQRRKWRSHNVQTGNRLRLHFSIEIMGTLTNTADMKN